MRVHLIADYGPGDRAFAGVARRIKCSLPDAELRTPVPPFSTLAAGFCIALLGLNDAPAGTVLYHNVAPREENREAGAANAGEKEPVDGAFPPGRECRGGLRPAPRRHPH